MLCFLCSIQASAFTTQRYIHRRKLSATTTTTSTTALQVPRAGPMIHWSTTLDQGESDFQARPMVDDTPLNSGKLPPKELDDEMSNAKKEEESVSKAKKTTPPTTSRSLPWSEFHDWALRDNIPKYTRILPGDTPKTFALWRTMLQEVPELTGYPINFLQTKYASKPLTTNPTQINNGNSSNSSALEAPEIVPEILPFLDNFYFEPSGGLSGQVRRVGRVSNF